MAQNEWYWTNGETPELSGTLARETSPNVFVEEDLSTVLSVTLTLYKPSGAVYKSGAAMTVVSGGKVKYAGVTADTQQGTLTGKVWVTYADGSKRPFPKPGRFSIRVDQ